MIFQEFLGQAETDWILQPPAPAMGGSDIVGRQPERDAGRESALWVDNNRTPNTQNTDNTRQQNPIPDTVSRAWRQNIQPKRHHYSCSRPEHGRLL